MIKMNEEIKYCKFCDKEKPKKDFCKSGSFIKNICRECQKKKQTKAYRDSKKVEQLQNNWNDLKEGLIGAISLLKDATDKTNSTIKDTFIGVLSEMQELENKDEI